MVSVVGVSGNIASPSRTRNLVDIIIQRASAQSGYKGHVIDISALVPELGATVGFKNFPPSLEAAYSKLESADLIVLASPIYKASYSGLFKHFLDLLDPSKLAGKVVILAATGGSEYHALSLEYQFRTLASFFGLVTVPTTIYVKDSEFENYHLNSEAVSKRIDIAVKQAQTLLEKNLEVETLAA